jgi:hypothetical protein
MRTLLHYANSAKVARGLTEKGYPVSGPTVSRWARGQNVTPRAVALVEELLGSGENEEAAWPEWAKRLNEKMDAILKDVVLADSLREARRTTAPPDSGATPHQIHERPEGGR